MAAAMLERELAMFELPVDVVSAGFGEAGIAATDATLDAAADFDLDLRSHRSRVIDAETLEHADLVIGMERAHVRDAVVLAPSVWPRAFTFREIVRRAEAASPRAPGMTLREWAGQLSGDRSRMELMGRSPADDIADPTSDWSADHGATARLIDDLVRRFVSRAWPSEPPH
jgi:protein-tyrosine-phosphatase